MKRNMREVVLREDLHNNCYTSIWITFNLLCKPDYTDSLSDGTHKSTYNSIVNGSWPNLCLSTSRNELHGQVCYCHSDRPALLIMINYYEPLVHATISAQTLVIPMELQTDMTISLGPQYNAHMTPRLPPN